MAELPAMPMWIGDFITSTTALNDAETGQYILLLFEMWWHGGYVDGDPERLARIARCKKVSRVVLDKLTECEDGTYTHPRLLKELGKVREKIEKRRAAGELGNKAKALKRQKAAHANGNALRTQSKSKSNTEANASVGTARGAVIPQDWQPSPKLVQAGKEIGLTETQITDSAERMVNWAIANANRAIARKADWNRTFLNWMKEEWDRRYSKLKETKRGPGSRADLDFCERMIAKHKGLRDEHDEDKPTAEIIDITPRSSRAS